MKSERSLRRCYAPDLPPAGSEFALAPEEARHAATVLRARPGDELVAFDGRGGRARCSIRSCSKREVVALVLEELPRQCRPHASRVLVAPPRAGHQEVLVRGLVELGIAELHPLLTTRGSFRPARAAEVLRRWERYAIEACKQSGRDTLPQLGSPVALDPEALGALETSLVLLSPTAPAPLESVLPTLATDSLGVVIGPEGGFTEEELTQAAAAGLASARLGTNVLRVETAAIAAATHLDLEHRRRLTTRESTPESGGRQDIHP